MREVPNPNETAHAIPISPAELARMAKTGCRECHGAGAVVARRSSDPGAEAARVLCQCVGRVLERRLDVVMRNEQVCWAPKHADAKVVLRPRTPAP